jgi:hypothetical protein
LCPENPYTVPLLDLEVSLVYSRVHKIISSVFFFKEAINNNHSVQLIMTLFFTELKRRKGSIIHVAQCHCPNTNSFVTALQEALSKWLIRHKMWLSTHPHFNMYD